MLIGELAAATGLSASRIRFYESNGMLSAARRKHNGYRDYPETAVEVLNLILLGQSLGFSLEEIRQVIPLGEGGAWKHPELLAMLRAKVVEIERIQQHLQASRLKLDGMIEALENRQEDGDCRKSQHLWQ